MKIAIEGHGLETVPAFYHGKRLNRDRLLIRVDDLNSPSFWCEIEIDRYTFSLLCQVHDGEVIGGIEVRGCGGPYSGRYKHRTFVKDRIVTIEVTDTKNVELLVIVYLDQIAMRTFSQEVWATLPSARPIDASNFVIAARDRLAAEKGELPKGPDSLRN